MPRPRSRRTVLALSASALLSLAGCLGDDTASDPSPTTGPAGTETTDVPTTDETSTEATTDHSDYRMIEITVHSADPGDVADAVVRQFSDLTQRQRRIISNSVTDGEHVHTTYVGKPLEDDTYVAYEDGYYRIRVEVAAERQRTGHVFRVEAVSGCEHRYDDEEQEAAREEAIEFDDLPNTDKEAFTFTNEEYLRGDTCFSSGYHYVYESESAVERSVLVSDDPTYVEYDRDVYAVLFRKTRVIPEYDYRYTPERIAGTEAELHGVMARDVAIHLRPNDLSPDERELLDELTEVPSYEKWKNPIPERVDDLVNRIRSHDTHGEWGRYFVEYRGEFYRFRIQEAVA